MQEHIVTGQGRMASNCERVGLDYMLRKNSSSCEGGEMLKPFAWGNCGCPMPGSVQNQAGWSSVQSSLGIGLELDDL